MDKKEEELLQSTSWADSLDISLLLDVPTDSDVSYSVCGTQKQTRETSLPRSDSNSQYRRDLHGISKDDALLSGENEGMLDPFDTSRSEFERNWRAERELSLQEIKLQLERQHLEQQRQLKMFQDAIESQLLAAQEKQVASLSMTSPNKSDDQWKASQTAGILATRNESKRARDEQIIEGSERHKAETGLEEQNTRHAVKSSPKTTHREETVVQPLQVDTAKRDIVSMFGNSTDTPEMLARARALLKQHEGGQTMVEHDGNTRSTESAEREVQERFGETPSPHPLTPRVHRISLVEKHKKHVDDLRAYYESEIDQLKVEFEQRLTRAKADDRQVRKLEQELEAVTIRNGLLEQRLNHADGNSGVYERAIEELKSTVAFLKQKLEREDSYLADCEHLISCLRYQLQESEEERWQQQCLIEKLKDNLVTSETKELRKLRHSNSMEERLTLILEQCRDLTTLVSRVEEEVLKDIDRSARRNFSHHTRDIQKQQLSGLQDFRTKLKQLAVELEELAKPRLAEMMRNKQHSDESLQLISCLQPDGSNLSQISPIEQQAIESRTRQKWLQPSEDNMLWRSRQIDQVSRRREVQETTRLSPLLGAQRDYYGDKENDELSASHTLAAVKSKAVVGMEEWEDSRQSSHRRVTTTKTSEAVAQRLQQIKMLEEQLADLMSEKNKVESAISHLPVRGKVTRQNRDDRLVAESRLEQLVKKIGSVRMKLKKLNVLKTH